MLYKGVRDEKSIIINLASKEYVFERRL